MQDSRKVLASLLWRICCAILPCSSLHILKTKASVLFNLYSVCLNCVKRSYNPTRLVLLKVKTKTNQS